MAEKNLKSYSFNVFCACYVMYIQEQVESVVSVVEKNLKNCTKEMLPEFQNKEWDDFQQL